MTSRWRRQVREASPDTSRPVANFEEVLEKQAWFCGTPAETVAYLQEIEARYPGLEHILLGFPMGASLSQFKEQLACFAHEVMPAFKKTAVGV